MINLVVTMIPIIGVLVFLAALGYRVGAVRVCCPSRDVVLSQEVSRSAPATVPVPIAVMINVYAPVEMINTGTLSYNTLPTWAQIPVAETKVIEGELVP